MEADRMLLSVQMKRLLILLSENITFRLLHFMYKTPYICISDLLIACSAGKAVAGRQKLL